MILAARVAGIGLVGPGIADWESGRAALSSPNAQAAAPTVVPAPEALPPVERRRCGKNVKLALAVGFEAARRSGRPPGDFATVFASSSGDGDNCHAICETLASDDRQISPTRFHNSVHNAPSGYWSIAARSTRASDSVCAFDASFAAGLLEALLPEPTGDGPVLRAAISHEPPDPLARADLERLRLGIPTARALPLLALLAGGQGASTAIEYLPGLSLRVEVAP